MNPHNIQDLLRTEAYPELTQSVHLVQTHVSFIFLTDHYVYKIKKEVDFGFLRFTTLGRRHFFCNEELRLNRRLCPEIYLDVVEVRQTKEGTRFFGEGPVIDYAVKMKRLPAHRMLDRLLDRGEVGFDDLELLGRIIGEFHLNARRSPRIDRFGELSMIRRNWEENFDQLAPFTGPTVPASDLQHLRRWVEDFLSDSGELFANRIRNGFIRDCDGDLHLENICLADTVCIFDCIEFNRRFRYCDTASDLAFLLMDFDFHGRSDCGNIVLGKYLSVTGDSGMRPLLPFYQAYRATVRGKVELFRAADRLLPAEEKEEAMERAGRYLELAKRYTAKRPPLSLIITCGIMGTGKSTIAGAISMAVGVEVASSDHVRKEQVGQPAMHHDYAGYGEGTYSVSQTEATYGELLARGEKALQEGRSIIIDASFAKKEHRLRFQRLAEGVGARFFLIEARCDDAIIRQRLEKRQFDRSQISDGRLEILDRQRQEFEPPGPDEHNLIFIDTSEPVHAIIPRILRVMELT